MKYNDWKVDAKQVITLTGIMIEVFELLLLFFIDAHNLYFKHHDINGKSGSRSRSYSVCKNS